MSITNSDLLESLRKDLEKADDLLLRDDPETEPYKSRYEARDILEKVIEKSGELANESLTRQIKAHIHAKIGAISNEVEELSKSQEDLEKGLALVEEEEGPRSTSLGRTIIPRLICLNQLGVLWCNRSELEKADSYLKKSLKAYEVFKQNGDGFIYKVEDILTGNDLDASGSEREKALELLNIHTYYFLAQVNEKLGDKDKAGECCHITLKKQLELKEYKAVDWATNAATLSHYYEVNQRWSAAKTHLAAADFVMKKHKSEVESKEFESEEEKENVMEKISLTFGLINRCWGKYSLTMLQMSLEKMLNPDSDEMRIEEIEDGEEVTMTEDFPSVEMDPEFEPIPTKLATNFEEARALFLPGQRYLNRAKEVYSMEDHCTDFTEINQDLSAMHKVLVPFEPDAGRKFGIHKRRLELLEYPLDMLSPSLYMLIRRQLLFELGETYESMMDVKLEKVAGTGVSAAVGAKINDCIRKSIKHFDLYLDTLKTGDAGKEKMPKKFHAENVRPALIAWFHLARLYDKMVLPPDEVDDGQQKLKNKLQTFCYFKMIVDYCKENKDSEAVVSQELPLCQEMVKLLPVKIEKMRLESELMRKRREQS